jgi:hypothetical protein
LQRDIDIGKVDAEKLRTRTVELEKLLFSGAPDPSFWTVELLKAIDQEAQKAFSSCRIEIGMKDDSYLTALISYLRNVLALIRTHHRNRENLEHTLGRVAWILFFHPDRVSVPLPLMTEYVIESVFMSLESFRGSIYEVSTHKFAFFEKRPDIEYVRYPA